MRVGSSFDNLVEILKQFLASSKIEKEKMSKREASIYAFGQMLHLRSVIKLFYWEIWVSVIEFLEN